MGFPNSTENCFHKKGHVSIISSQHEHAQYLQDKLRKEDLYECFIHRVTPFMALHQPIKEKDGYVFTALFKDEPVAMFGVADVKNDLDINAGTVWMLGSKELYKCQLSLTKTSKQIVDWLMTEYDMLENIVPAKNKKTINWLKFLGFTVKNTPINVNNYDCFHFVRCHSLK